MCLHSDGYSVLVYPRQYGGGLASGRAGDIDSVSDTCRAPVEQGLALMKRPGERPAVINIAIGSAGEAGTGGNCCDGRASVTLRGACLSPAGYVVTLHLGQLL